MLQSVKDSFRAKFSVWDVMYPPPMNDNLPPVPVADLSEVVVNEFSYAPLSPTPGPDRRYRIFWNVSGPTDLPWSLNLFNTENEPLNNPLPLIGEAETQPRVSGKYALKAMAGGRERLLGLLEIQQDLQACSFNSTTDLQAYLYWFFAGVAPGSLPDCYFDGDPMDNMDVDISEGLVRFRMTVRYRAGYSYDPFVDVDCRFGFGVIDDVFNPLLKRVFIYYHSFGVTPYFKAYQWPTPFANEGFFQFAKSNVELGTRYLLTRLSNTDVVRGVTPSGNSLYSADLLSIDGGTLRRRYCPITVPEAVAWDKVMKSKIKIKTL